MDENPGPAQIATPIERKPMPFHLGLLARLRAYFLAGVLVTAPVAVTFYIVWLIVSFVDNRVSQLIPARYVLRIISPSAFPALAWSSRSSSSP
jgi:hypothetical protein